MIVRISGPDSFPILQMLRSVKTDPPAGSVSRTELSCDGIDFSAWCYAMRSPRSATGEDSVELHIPGNPILAGIVLKSILNAGARAAEAGEFTARAFFNRRLDLAGAEGVAAVIAAQNAAELSAARQLMSGELSRRLQPTLAGLIETLALLESGIDFAEEEIATLPRESLLERTRQLDRNLDELLRTSGRFSSLTHEPTIALVGRPNAGKSSLLNALAGHERAVVSATAGTTRDALSAVIRLRHGFVRVIDIPGIEEMDAADSVSVAAQQAAKRAIEAADVVVLVRDITDHRSDLAIERVDTIVQTKSDLGAPSAIANECGDHPTSEPRIYMRGFFNGREAGSSCDISTVDGTGMQKLRERFDDLVFGSNRNASVVLNARHERAIVAARDAFARVLQSGEVADELNALELREALDALGSIVGEITPDAILGKIFSTFCIGK